MGKSLLLKLGPEDFFLIFAYFLQLCLLPQVTVLGPVFIKFGHKHTDKLYLHNCHLGQSAGVHLYGRAPYLHGRKFSTSLDHIRTANTTFGRVARYVLFGDAAICP